MNPRKLRLLALTALIVFPVGHVAGGPAGSQPRAELDAKQQRYVNRLVSQFRRAHKNPQRQAEIVQQAMQFGRPAVVALYSLLSEEMYPQLESYRDKFSRQAAIAIRKKPGKIDPAEVAKLRAALLGLQNEANFTKETILQKGDPAVGRLAEIFLVERTEVLAQSKALQAERVKLQGPGLLWQQCGVYLYNLMPKGDNKPKEPMSFEKYVQAEEELAVGLAAPIGDQARRVLVDNLRLAPQLGPEEARGILELNLMRNLLGLPPLAVDLRLCATARDHSKDMRRLKFFAHESPLPGKVSPWDRARRFGTAAAAENIYRGAHQARAANRAWFHSPDHHKNLLGQYARVGLGRSGAYFTLLFGR